MTARDALLQVLQDPLSSEEEQEARQVLQLFVELADVWCLLDDDASAEELLDLSQQELQRELDCIDDLLYCCAFASEREPSMFDICQEEYPL